MNIQDALKQEIATHEGHLMALRAALAIYDKSAEVIGGGRGRARGRAWTKADDEYLRSARAKSVGFNAISRSLNRSEGACQTRHSQLLHMVKN